MYYFTLIFSTFLQLVSINNNQLIIKLITEKEYNETLKPVLYLFSINRHSMQYHSQYLFDRIANYFFIKVNLKIEEGPAIFFAKLLLFNNNTIIFSGFVSTELFTEKNRFKSEKINILFLNNPYLKPINFIDEKIFLREINGDFCTIETKYNGPLNIELYGLRKSGDYFSSAYYISSMNDNKYKLFFTNLKNFPNKKYIFFLLLNNNFTFMRGEKTDNKKITKNFNSEMNKMI